MKKQELRNKVWQKYDCKCAYCGSELPLSKMQIDHIVPIYRNVNDEELDRMNIIRGWDEFNNYNPSCARCNKWKGTFTIDKFRSEIEKQTERLQRDSPSFRMAFDYKLINISFTSVKFWFETYNLKN